MKIKPGLYATKNGNVVTIVKKLAEGIVGHSRSCVFPRVHWDVEGKFIANELYPHFGDGFDLSHKVDKRTTIEGDGRNFDWDNLREKNVRS